MKAPVYVDQGKTYHADSCEPVKAAVRQGELSLQAICRGSYPGDQIPGAIGLSSLTVSSKLVEASAQKLHEFQERDLSDLDLVAVLLDGKSFADETML